MSSSDVQKADADLWLAYGIKLKNTIAQSSGSGPNDRFYIAPLSAAGIAAGRRVEDAIKNNGVYGVGDALLELDQPVFLPSRQSYFQRCQSYCSSIALQSDNNMGATFRYNDAQTKQKNALKDFQDTKTAAITAWKAENVAGLTSDPFPSWVVQNYPEYAQAQMANDGATAACASAAGAMSGPKAAMVGRYMSALNSADGLVPIPGLTMTCSPASADQISAGQAGTPGSAYQRPLYEINAQYAQTVDGWIGTYAQNKANPTTINFKLSDSTNSSWNDLGFSSSNVQVTGSYCIFFSATFTENNTTVTKNVSAAECGSDLEVTVTTTGQSSFDIHPGKWNPGELAGMPIVDNADPNLKKPMAFVNKAFLAYGVGIQVTLSANASSTVSNYLEKARTTGGSASIFGYNIGLGGSASSTQTSTTTFDQVKNASTGTTITIPPADNAYPTLLAVFGQAIPLPGTVSS